MTTIRHIERSGYHVIDWRGERCLALDDLLQSYPELVVDRFLVNTSFDSGFLTLAESEVRDGWRMVARLAHSPRIQSIEQVPHDQFDEWLVFEESVQVGAFETMVNYLKFSPIDFDWEEKLETFWEQVVRLHPLHVLAENEGLYLVSRDEKLVKRIIADHPDIAEPRSSETP
jgi:hypothetical protein